MGPELNYSPIEKTCLALIFSTKKLRHYMQAYTVHLIAHADSIKYVLSKPYEIIYIPQKAIKGQALAKFLADHPIPTAWESSNDPPDKEIFYVDIFLSWMMFFDGSARYDGTGILPYSFVLSERCSNNVLEYQALIIGLQMAIKMKITSLEICGDSKLVISQLLALYEVKSDDLVPYFQYSTQLMEKFKRISLVHIPQKENQMEDALANLAASLTLLKDETVHIPLFHRWVLPPLSILQQEEVNTTSVFTIDSED
ncbi:hypothetical protein AAG906_026172 [Vitis piasezkii]